MKCVSLPVAASAAFLLAGCGQYLGEYSVEAVAIAATIPIPGETAAHYGQFLEVSLSSETSLTALADKVDGVYVDADFCPLREPDEAIAFGPFSATGEELGLPSAASPLRPGADGRFHYRIYIPVAYRAQTVTQAGQIQLPTYDLRPADRDLCLQLSAPGYDLIRSRSDTIVVPAPVIAAALTGETAANRRPAPR